MLLRFSHTLFIMLITLWLGTSALIDFVIVPSAFAQISNFFEAGNLGMNLFSKYNIVEVILASALLALLALTLKSGKKLVLVFLLSFVCWIIAMTYFTWLTPKIIHLTGLWKKAETAGNLSIAGHQDIQQVHQFYHGLYISLDGLKMLLLSAMLFLGFYQERSWR